MAHSVSRSTVLAGLIASAIVALAPPAEAKKKKAEPSEDSPAAEPDEATGDKKAPAKPAAAQSGDTERPKPILDATEEGPKADKEGNVAFAGTRKGKGKITVQAPAKDKVKVYLEGKYFGTAPRSINNIPPGDYIVEVVFPNGKSLSKPVSVSGNEESIVQVGAADAQPVAPIDQGMTPEQADKRWRIARTMGIGAVSAVVIGLGLSYWEHTVQNDYNSKVAQGPATNNASDKAAHQADLDALSSKGDKLALGANICYVVGGVALITAVIIGYPAYKARSTEHKAPSPEAGTNMSFMFAPTPSLKGAAAGLTFQF